MRQGGDGRDRESFETGEEVEETGRERGFEIRRGWERQGEF